MSRRIQPLAVVFLTVLLLSGFASAQLTTFYSGQTGATQYNDGARYALKGTVVNSVTEEPVPHALVQVMSANQRSVLAGNDGSFEVPDLPASRTWVTARKPGYFSQQEMGRRVSRPQWVQIGPGAEPVTIKLVPEAVIFGRVEDADGEPVEGASVQLMNLQVMDGRRTWQRVQGSQTNEDGEFRVANLRPGSYYVAVAATMNPARLAMAQRGVGYPAAWYYPGAPDREAATPLRLTPGQRMEMSFTLPLQPVFRVSGRVTGYPPGRPPNFQLMSGEQGASFPQQFDPATGRFEIAGVPAGNYRLHAIAPGAPGQTMAADVPLAVAGSVSNVRLTLLPETVIPVEVRTDFVQPKTGGGAENYAGVPRNYAPQVSVQLHSRESTERALFSTMSGPPDSMKTEIRNVLPGTYTAEIHPNGPWYVASAVCGTTDLLREPLTVIPGQQLPPIEVVLRDDTATLGVSVRVNSDQEMYAVLILPDSGSVTPPRMAMQSGNGTFEMPGLPPGDYRVLAFDDADGLEYRDPEAMKEYMPKSVPVTLTAGAKSTVTLDVIRRGE